MSENVIVGNGPGDFARPRAFDTIVFGGLAVGILDMLFAFVFYGLILGVPYQRIFQSVAAGVLGRPSYDGGTKTFALGLLLHFLVATCVATVYYLASRTIPLLIRYAVPSGLIYGVVVYFGMKNIVLPFSAIGRRGTLPTTGILVVELIGHAVLVGLPVALIAKRSAKANQ